MKTMVSMFRDLAEQMIEAETAQATEAERQLTNPLTGEVIDLAGSNDALIEGLDGLRQAEDQIRSLRALVEDEITGRVAGLKSKTRHLKGEVWRVEVQMPDATIFSGGALAALWKDGDRPPPGLDPEKVEAALKRWLRPAGIEVSRAAWNSAQNTVGTPEEERAKTLIRAAEGPSTRRPYVRITSRPGEKE
jgi:hypothetical protein